MDYTFDIRWTQAFESTWCTREKFKYANAINGRECLKILDMPSVNYDGITNDNSLLAELRAIKKLGKLLSHDFNHITWIKELLGPLYCDKTFPRYFASYFRYCPKCLEYGYHTMYTQLLWVKDCPFHNIPLKTRINVGRSSKSYIPAGIYGRKMCKGFEIISDVQMISLSSKEIFLHWLNPLDVECITNKAVPIRDYSYHLHYMPFSLDRHDYKINYFINSSLKIEQLIALDIRRFFNSSKIVSPLSLLIPWEREFSKDNLRTYIIDLYIAIYKSIAKHLRKHNRGILIMANVFNGYWTGKSAQSILDFARKGIITKSVYAYILWNRDILGYHSYMNLCRRRIISNSNIVNTHFFKYIMYEAEQYLLLDPSISIKNLLSVLQYIISKVFWAHYKHYDISSDMLIDMIEDGTFSLNTKTLGDSPLLSYYDKASDTCYVLDSSYL